MSCLCSLINDMYIFTFFESLGQQDTPAFESTFLYSSYLYYTQRSNNSQIDRYDQLVRQINSRTLQPSSPHSYIQAICITHSTVIIPRQIDRYEQLVRQINSRTVQPSSPHSYIQAICITHSTVIIPRQIDRYEQIIRQIDMSR